MHRGCELLNAIYGPTPYCAVLPLPHFYFFLLSPGQIRLPCRLRPPPVPALPPATRQNKHIMDVCCVLMLKMEYTDEFMNTPFYRLIFTMVLHELKCLCAAHKLHGLYELLCGQYTSFHSLYAAKCAMLRSVKPEELLRLFIAVQHNDKEKMHELLKCNPRAFEGHCCTPYTDHFTRIRNSDDSRVHMLTSSKIPHDYDGKGLLFCKYNSDPIDIINLAELLDDKDKVMLQESLQNTRSYSTDLVIRMHQRCKSTTHARAVFDTMRRCITVSCIDEEPSYSIALCISLSRLYEEYVMFCCEDIRNVSPTLIFDAQLTLCRTQLCLFENSGPTRKRWAHVEIEDVIAMIWRIWGGGVAR